MGGCGPVLVCFCHDSMFCHVFNAAPQILYVFVHLTLFQSRVWATVESPKGKLATPSQSHYPHSFFPCQSAFSNQHGWSSNIQTRLEHQKLQGFFVKKSFLETYPEAPCFLIHWPKCSRFDIRSWWCKAARPGKSGQRAKGFPRTKNQKRNKCKILQNNSDSDMMENHQKNAPGNGQHRSKIGAKRYHGSCPRDIHGSCLLRCSERLFWCWSIWSTIYIFYILKFPALQAHTAGSKVP